MSDIDLILDGAESHVVTAALGLYEAHLAACRDLGGDALDVATAYEPIVRRVSAKLHEQMFGPDEPTEPLWLHSEFPPEMTFARLAEAEGDHFVFPNGVGR